MERREKRTMIREDTLVVAIDIGMITNTVYCCDIYGNGTKTASFNHSREGYEKLLSLVHRAKKRFNCTREVVGYEPTGPYGEPLIHYLAGKGIPLVQINPMHTKKLKELNDNSPLKTDKKDPRVIADIMRLGHTLSVVVPKGDAAELRRLMNLRDRHVEERVALINHLKQLIFVLFPEFIGIIKNLKSATGMMLVRDYIATGLLWETDYENLKRALSATSRGKLGHTEAEGLIASATRSVGIREGMSGIAMDINHAVMQIATVTAFIDHAEKRMESIIQRIPCAQRIRSVKGIGTITIAGLIGEIGSFGAFSTQGEVMKFAGLNIYEVSSGKHRGKRRISKRGRSRLRNLLYLAALNTVRKGGVMHGYYRRLLTNGLHKVSALVAVSRKLLRIIFALVRDGNDYGMKEYEAAKAA